MKQLGCSAFMSVLQVEDGVVKKIHLEGGGGLTTATAEVLLSEI